MHAGAMHAAGDMEIKGWRLLYRRARAQAGVVTSADARDVGIPRTTFHRRVAREGWQDAFPGAWLVPGASTTASSRHWAALLTTGPDSALSHATAARLLDLERGSGEGGRRIHVVRPYGHGSKRPPGLIVHRSRHLAERDRTTVEGLVVTTAARTLMDIAADHPIWRLEAMMLAARQRGLLDLASLVDQYERRPGLVGARAFRAASRLLAEDGADSVLERRARRRLRAANLHPSAAPHPVRCENVTLHVDIAFPERRVGIECDGFAYHGPNEQDAFEFDRRRWGKLQDAGWRIVWLTWRRLHEHPASFIAEVRRKLAE